jgi:hypothetical protein
MLRSKITVVTVPPSSGCPEDSSKIEPTAAIPAIHEPPKNKALFGVPTIFVFTQFVKKS